eukprot:TRINITY_DN2055_c0_g3_i1.p1 TRINITY_DN2055_c0_g3~~TRINITY_DN2055_c0_g3_i1.p1  ORF type:complete len:393 (-),score=50.90 TRINITY_DN2055_c0_g3_i1:131-1309(-)
MSSGLNATKTNTSGTQDHTRQRKSSPEAFSIMDLPSEIIVYIFSHLDLCWYGHHQYHLTDVASLVCKQWYQLSLEPSLWQEYNMQLDEVLFPKEIKKLVKPKYSKVQLLEFHGDMGNSSSAHYAHIIFGMYQKCAKCSFVASQLTETQLVNIAQILKNTTELAFVDYPVEDSIFPEICNLSLLSYLSLSGPYYDMDTSLKYLPKISTLKNLTFGFPIDFDESEDNYLERISVLTNLEKLDFLHFPLHEDISHLSKLSKLNTLRFWSLYNIDEAFFVGLSAVTQMQSLFLQIESDFEFEHTLIQPLPKLSEFTLHGDIPSEQFIPFLTPFLPNLETIFFQGGVNTILSRFQIEEMISLAPRLRTAVLRCRRISTEEWLYLWGKYKGKVEFKFK